MRLFEIEFYNAAIPNMIVFAEKRLDIWNKFKGIRCMNEIVII